MNKERLHAFFHHTNLVSAATVNEIADRFQYKAIGKNEFLLTENKIADEYLFLDQGYMRAFCFDFEGMRSVQTFTNRGR